MNIPKLRESVKRRWLDALRSGHFQQGRQRLHYRAAGGGELYCCLGVLCSLAEEEGVVRRTPLATTPNWFNYGGTWSMPPRTVALWAYEEDPGQQAWSVLGTVDSDGWQNWDVLSDLNDEQGLSFAEIADRIEASL